MKEDRILKTIPIFQVDAFSTQPFSGNPAAVCPVSGFLTDKEMIAISAENNLSETAFVDLTIDPFFIRWFTPKVEVNLCGHATLLRRVSYLTNTYQVRLTALNSTQKVGG